MIPFFPKQISSRAIVIYLIALATVSLVFVKRMMGLDFIIIGIAWVVVFFLLSSRFSIKWANIEEKKFVRKLFWTALGFRLFWVLFSYVYYILKTGVPFEFNSADAIDYHWTALWFLDIGWKETLQRLSHFSVGDMGYPFYLTLIYYIFGPNVLLARVFKALMSAFTAVLVYRLTKSTINEATGRLAGIFCCLAPNLIMYCGMHLKETEMIFLTVATLERANHLLRSPKIKVWDVIVTLLLIGSLFTFRSVLGSSAVFAIITAMVFSSTAVIGRWNRVVLISWTILAVAVFAGGTIANEAEQLWRGRNYNQTAKRDWQVRKGMKWAKYATGTVMAPMMFVLPFPTMVDVDGQYNQQLINSGNYVRNFMGIFVLIGIFSAVFVQRKWRDFSLIGAFVIAYLGVISASGFANSERFLLPGMPILLIIAAYGITQLDAKNFKWVKGWYAVVLLMAVSWAFFKLGTRNML